MNFSPLNVDFSAPNPDPLDLRRPAYAGVKQGYPAKKGFNAVGWYSVKTVANRHRHGAYHIKQCQ